MCVFCVSCLIDDLIKVDLFTSLAVSFYQLFHTLHITSQFFLIPFTYRRLVYLAATFKV